jgi:hypothetical protein
MRQWAIRHATADLHALTTTELRGQLVRVNATLGRRLERPSQCPGSLQPMTPQADVSDTTVSC